MAQQIIVDVASGKQTTRTLSAQEQAEYDAQVAAEALRQQQETTRQADRQAARDLVLPIAQPAVGARFDALTTAQLRALLAILLWDAGALDKAGMVRDLTLWVKR